MAVEIITLQNGGEVPQHAYDAKGKRHTLEGHQVLPFPQPIAKLFLDQRGQFVHVFKPVIVPKGKIGEAVAYVANVTGSPFLPAEVAHKYQDRTTKLEVSTMVPNPLRTPTPIVREYHVPQEIILAPSGEKTTLSHPPIKVILPPWIRVPVPESCAEWLERRDAMQDEKYLGAVIRARSPTAWEPNDTWEFHEILVYARMVDDDAMSWLGLEQEVYKAISSNDEIRVAEFKIKLLNHLFYHLIDERWALPSKEAFDAKLAEVMEQMTAEKPKGRRAQADA